MGAERVRITGLRELSAAFRKVDAGITTELRVTFKGIAEAVVRVAQQRMPIRSGRAASSVKPRGTQKGAAVAFGGARAEYMPWLDFGGTTGRGHHPGGGGAIKRPFTPPGRYVYPAISEQREETEAAAFAAIEHAARSAGFDWNDL